MRTTGVFAALLVARSGRYVKCSLFANAQQALDAGFRPCKRCQPDNARAQQRRLDKIACACRLLEQETPVTLASLAQAVAMSPFHLHRLFKASTGMTPKGWQQAWRARRLREALAKGEPITAAIYRAGFPDSSSYYRHADQTLGMTAKQFRKGGDNVSVRYALTDWVYGRCTVAESGRGFARFSPVIATMRYWPNYTLFPAARHEPADAPFQQRVRQVVAAINTRDVLLSLPLDIREPRFNSRSGRRYARFPAAKP
ncbi:bifunctional DNA-binding transcriptional regulator/O6-methylguanine-DNA methyltransferase Ada [Salmonella sp. WGH-01]|nr:bifunctional DNA-binding transcriptional regulator/O6-methylguanine-DNA methyltransferase Ada [Salmonella sp. WGH-01]